MSDTDDGAILAQLNRILRSSSFASSPRLRAFLQFIVDETLQGVELKESVIGMGVFGKNADWDPQRESVVRTTANRLRQQLSKYYNTEGHSDLVTIDLAKGSYVPRFSRQNSSIPPPQGAILPMARDSAGTTQRRIKRPWTVWLCITICLTAFAFAGHAGAYGNAIVAISIAMLLSLLAYTQSEDTVLARMGLSVMALAAMAYIPSAATLPMLADTVVNLSRLPVALVYPFITGLKFIPLFVLLLACWTFRPLWEISDPSKNQFDWRYFGCGVVALGLTLLSISAFSGDKRILDLKLAGWQALVAGYVWIYGANFILWIAGYRLLKRGVGTNRPLLLRCALAYVVVMPAALIVDREYNMINRSYLDKRRPEIYTVAEPNAIARFGTSLDSKEGLIGPDLAELFHDPIFVTKLRSGYFYKEDFDEPFQFRERAVMFGYQAAAPNGVTRPRFIIVRFPRAVAEALHFQAAGDEK